jgi:hypothetical protein
MNHLEKVDQGTFRQRFKLLSASAKSFLAFNVLAPILAVLSGGLFAVNEASALSGLVEAMLTFAVFYILIASLVINFGSAYNRERNVIAAIIPLLMAITGLAMSFWLYDEYISDQIGIISIAIAGATVVLMPIISFSLARALSIKAEKLYTICFWQIIGTAFLAWLEFSLFI